MTKTEDNPTHPKTQRVTFAPGTTLPSADEARDAMPVASGRR